MSLIDESARTDKVLFKSARIVDPEKRTEANTDLLVQEGRVEHIGLVDAESFDGRIVEVNNRVLCPGLVDMHVHLREPGREDEETIESGCQAAMAGGFTGVCAMPNTDPTTDNSKIIRYLKDRSRDLLVDVFPIAAVTMGRAGVELTEMGELIEAGAVAFSDDGDPVATSELLRRAFEYASMFDVPIIDHCEDKTLSQCGAMHEGRVSTRLGLPGIPGVSEDIIVARDIQIAEYTGGRLHIAHISTAASVEMVRQAKAKGIAITCEVMTHHFLLNHEAVLDYDTNAKMNPPLRAQEDVDAMIEGLKDGTIDVIATDHAPHSIEEKDVEFQAAPFGIIGLETALGLVLTHLVNKKVLTISEAIAKMTLAPASVLKLERGRIRKGDAASLTIFDPSPEWTVDKTQFKSKCRNTPFNGWKLNGEIGALYNNGLLWESRK